MQQQYELGTVQGLKSPDMSAMCDLSVYIMIKRRQTPAKSSQSRKEGDPSIIILLFIEAEIPGVHIESSISDQFSCF